MELALSLQLKQLQLFWEGFSQGLGVCLWEFLTILLESHLWGQALMLDEKAWVAGQSSSFTPNSLIHVFMDLALCTGAQSCWNRKGPSPNCSHKVGWKKLSNMSWYAEAFRVKPNPWKTTQHHNPPSTKLYTWHNRNHKPQNPDSSIWLPNREVWFVTPENTSSLL